jgi:L-rhamnose-H+ transport protein
MLAGPLIGVLFHWLGGLSSASFYAPYRGVRGWSWEIFWLFGGVFSWLIAPWFFASVQTSDLLGVLGAAPKETLFWCYLFGALWGLGGLTFGLTMRYLGMSLGMAIALGFTTAFGTLIPPIVSGQLVDTLIRVLSGQIILVGIAVTLLGIVIVALAGRSKESEMSQAEKTKAIHEFDFRKGLMLATFSGIMSSCFAFGLAAGEPIRQLSLGAGTGVLWQGLPVLCVVLAGGFTTNFLWCAYLIAKNRSLPELFGGKGKTTPDIGMATPLARNSFLCALGGLLWYFQFFFYTMGESQMGAYGFSSWTLHMASIIIFSTLWGFVLKEWAGASGKTLSLVWLGIATLVGATIIIGYGNYLGAAG